MDSSPALPFCSASGFARITGYSVSATVGKNCRFLQGQGTDLTALTELRQALKAGRACVVQVRGHLGCLAWCMCIPCLTHTYSVHRGSALGMTGTRVSTEAEAVPRAAQTRGHRHEAEAVEGGRTVLGGGGSSLGNHAHPNQSAWCSWCARSCSTTRRMGTPS